MTTLKTLTRRLERAEHFETEGRVELAKIERETTAIELLKSLGLDERELDVVGMFVRKAERRDSEGATASGDIRREAS